VFEKQFQSQVIDLAQKLGYLCYHTYDSRRCSPGFPDIVIVGRGRILYRDREMKTSKGKLTDAQRNWGEKLQASGGDWCVWRPSDMEEIIANLMKGKKG